MKDTGSPLFQKAIGNSQEFVGVEQQNTRKRCKMAYIIWSRTTLWFATLQD